MFVFLNLVCIAALVASTRHQTLGCAEPAAGGTMPLIPHVVELHFVYNEGWLSACSAAGRRS